MKEEIKKIIKELKNVDEKFGYRHFETAVYIYMRLGDTAIDDLAEEDVKDLDTYMEYIDGSIFDEDLNNWTLENLEV